LRSRRFRDWRFRRHHPLGPFVVDFVCIEQALVIEIEHGRHDERAAARRLFLERLGFRVLRFAADAVLADTSTVRQTIRAQLATSAAPARRTRT
jgi:adenine-specific DNA-methyltransferase